MGCDEKEVKEALSAKLTKKEREKKMTLIINMGDHFMNKKVIVANRGQLVVSRATNDSKVQASSYGPCTTCFKWLLLDQLSRHNCPYKNDKKPGLKPKRLKHAAKKMILLEESKENPLKSNLAHHVAECLASLSNDKIGKIAQTDPLIKSFAMNHLKTKIDKTGDYRACKERVRELAHLLDELRARAKDETRNLASFYNPREWRLMVTTIRECYLDNGKNQRARQTCFSIHDCAE